MRRLQVLVTQFWLIAALLTLVCIAAKPLRNLQVVYRDKVYVVSDVNTVEELVDRLRRSSDIPSIDTQSCNVIHKGTVLENGQSLRKAGVQDGANVIVIPKNYRPKITEALALFLEMMDVEGIEKLKKQMKDPDDPLDMAGMKDMLKGIRYISREEVSESLRNFLDFSYRKLRVGWEHPAFRRALHDTEQIEAFRQVVDKHLSKKILQDMPEAKELVENSDAWRRQILKLSAGIIRMGDAVLDGVLDVLLDVLKGAGKTKTGGEYSYMSSSSYPTNPHINPAMEDPAKASDLLNELSESEDESF